MKSGPLWCLSVAVTLEAEDAVVELLENIFHQPPSVYTDAESGRSSVTVYLASRSAVSAARHARIVAGRARIRACGLDPGPNVISFRKIRREDWAESWKRHFQPMRIGNTLLIKPSWSGCGPERGQAVVVLDPGLSFGTGQHPTTRFCLEQLAACYKPGQTQSFLDIGTGSGILAIAAAKLGFRPVEGFDFDRAAVRIAQDNARRNRETEHLRLFRQDLTRLPIRSGRKYDVICANLIADLLIAERTRIVNRLITSGTLVLAGVLGAQFAAVRRAYQACGLRLTARQSENEWESGAFVRV